MQLKIFLSAKQEIGLRQRKYVLDELMENRWETSDYAFIYMYILQSKFGRKG